MLIHYLGTGEKMSLKRMLVLFFVLISCYLNAKYPIWIAQIPQSDYFYYYTGTGSSDKIEPAKKSAISNAILEVIQSDKITIEGQQEVKSKEIEENGKVDYRIEIIEDVLIKGESKDIDGLKKVSEFWEIKDSTYNYWVMLRIPKKVSFKDLPIYRNNKFAPIWRSSIIPGWGQIYKKQKIKGSFIIGSELVFLSSFSYFAYIGKDFADKERNEIFDMDKREIYKKNKDLAYNISFISIVGASVVYLYNLYDAIASKGFPLYTSNTFQIQPSFYSYNTPRISITYKF